jgi:pyruvate dehydrogenase E2 component (dihydrolipoamide acetyltransferase)
LPWPSCLRSGGRFARRADHEPRGIRIRETGFAALYGMIKRVPNSLNASLDEEHQELVLKRYYHFGIAVDTPRGLIVPVIRDVDRKSLVELAIELAGVVQRTRDGKVALDELHGGTFTLTNAGALGGNAFIPIINYPEVAILGIGAILYAARGGTGASRPERAPDSCLSALIPGTFSFQRPRRARIARTP